jgi:hypothetical protein
MSVFEDWLRQKRMEYQIHKILKGLDKLERMLEDEKIYSAQLQALRDREK